MCRSPTRPPLPSRFLFFPMFFNRVPVAVRILGGTGTGEPVQNKIKYKIQNKKSRNTKIAVSILQRNIAKYSTLGGIHQVLGNMLRTFKLETIFLDTNDPWAGILAATAFAIRNTYHTTLKATPGQLVFG